MSKKKYRIVVGLSGGVDSSIAAWVLRKQGHEVIGIFMKNWEDDTDECSTREDFLDAASVADLLDIEMEVVNFSKEYKQKVFDSFLQEYKAGRTPNPDVFCNTEIKFSSFLDHALNLGADYMATGHYGCIEKRNGHYFLIKGQDGTKDQTYFLHRLSQKQLSKSLFPIGKMYKSDVRELARKIGLPNYAKKDSTGLCFIGERPFRQFLGKYLPDDPGEIYNEKGEFMGNHRGLMYYTIGQRQGIGIGGSGKPWYVMKKDLTKNHLIVVQGHNHAGLLSDSLVAKDASWVSGVKPRTQWVYTAKTRYRQECSPCTIEMINEEYFTLKFAEPQWAMTPGQSVVIYESNVCLGGGIIDSTF